MTGCPQIAAWNLPIMAPLRHRSWPPTTRPLTPRAGRLARNGPNRRPSSALAGPSRSRAISNPSWTWIQCWSALPRKMMRYTRQMRSMTLTVSTVESGSWARIIDAVSKVLSVDVRRASQLLPRPERRPRFVQDPYPAYDRMRALGSLVYWQDYALPCTTSFAATNAVLRDRRFGRVPLDPPKIAPHSGPVLRQSRRIPCWNWNRRATRGLRGLVLRAFTFAPDRLAPCARDRRTRA